MKGFAFSELSELLNTEDLWRVSLTKLLKEHPETEMPDEANRVLVTDEGRVLFTNMPYAGGMVESYYLKNAPDRVWLTDHYIRINEEPTENLSCVRIHSLSLPDDRISRVAVLTRKLIQLGTTLEDLPSWARYVFVNENGLVGFSKEQLVTAKAAGMWVSEIGHSGWKVYLDIVDLPAGFDWAKAFYPINLL